MFFFFIFFITSFRPQQAIEKATAFYKQDLPRCRQLKRITFLWPQGARCFFLIFFITSFRPQQAIEKATAFAKQDLPRFRQCQTHYTFVDPSRQMFSLCFFFRYVFSVERAMQKSSDFSQTKLAKI